MKINSIIICKDHPEWGNWTITEDTGEWYVIRGNRGSKVLFYNELIDFWNIVL